MKLRRKMKIQRVWYNKGAEISWFKVYPLFLVQIVVFSVMAFALAYAEADTEVPLVMLYIFSGFAMLMYLVFYLAYFGRDSWRWTYTNTALGLVAFLASIDRITALFDKTYADFPWFVHAVPALFFIQYTFFLRQALLDLAAVGEHPERQDQVEQLFIIGLVLIFSALYLL